MIWLLTKANHGLSTGPLVRGWLRAGVMTRFVVILPIYLVLLGISIPVGLVGAAIVAGLPRDARLVSYFVSFIQVVYQAIIALVWLFWVVDAIVERAVTRGDIAKMMALPDIVLATRGEYIGGHPMLPDGRFVYLVLAGTLEKPELKIVLPQPEGRPDKTFSMPVLDLQRATERVEPTGDETTVSVMLADVTFRAKFLGQEALLNVEYISKAGRKQLVEVGHFLFGDGEVQGWRNYIVCIQAEAETGQRPYGPWKTLPAAKKTKTTEVGPAVVN